MVTLADVQRVALRHWEAGKGYTTMATGLAACLGLLGASTDVSTLGAKDGVEVLAGLTAKGLGRKSVGLYYGTLRRALALSGISTVDWPKPPTVERRTRDPMGDAEGVTLEQWLRARYPETADLLVFIRGTGLRVQVEALTSAHLTHTEGEAYDVLHIVGKGGHERVLPVVRRDTIELLRSASRMAAMQAVKYKTHLRRWNDGVAACGITSRLATPHSVRHGYATDAHSRSGGNLVLVQELLGHADPATTARYVSVDLDQKAGALSAS